MSDTRSLLRLINTQQKYEDFRKFLDAARVVKMYSVGPLYRAIPAATNPYDKYNVDNQVFFPDEETIRAYSRIVHHNLTGHYRMANALPRFASGRDLDLHSLNTYLAPFNPSIALPSALSAIRQWDRNAKSFFPEQTVVFTTFYQPNDPRLFFRGNNSIEQLLPLYTNYRQQTGLPNRLGVPLNRNTITIANYLKTLLSSLDGYRKKVQEVAKVIASTTRLTEQRTQLVRRLARVQQNRLQQLDRLADDSSLSRRQRDLLSAFRSQYDRFLRQFESTRE